MMQEDSDQILDWMLRRRGFESAGMNDQKQVICPDGPHVMPWLEYIDLLGKKSTRKMLRALTKAGPKGLLREELAKVAGTAGKKIDERVDDLVRLGILKLGDDGYLALSKPVDNIGPTLEWYVAQVIGREMAGASGWGVKLKGITVGGDYDVLAWIDQLLYVETKARRPDAITKQEMLLFLQRGEELSPEIQVLMIDTDDDLGTFVDRIFLEAMREPIGLPANWSPVRENMFTAPGHPYDGIYTFGRRLYVTNTKAGVAEALRRCVRHYNRVNRYLVIFASREPMNWVKVTKSPDPNNVDDG